MSAFSNFLEIFRPSWMEKRYQSAIERNRQNALSALSPFVSREITTQTPFEFGEADTFGMTDEGMVDPLDQLKGSQNYLSTQTQQLPGLFNQRQAEGLASLLSTPQTQGFGQALLSSMIPKKGESLFNKIDPSKYTPESIKAFSLSGDYSQLKPTSGGAFEGTGMAAQGGNVLIEGMELLRQGKPISSQLKDQINFVASDLTTPRTITDAAGNVQTIPGQDLSAFKALLDHAGFKQDKPGETGKPRQTQDAAALSGLNLVNHEMALIEGGLFDKSGRVDRGMLATMQTELPFSKGRTLSQAFERAIEVVLRIKTGAQANETEIKKMAEIYKPNSLDSDAAIQNKLAALNNWSAAVSDLMRRGIKPGSPEFNAIDPRVNSAYSPTGQAAGDFKVISREKVK